MEGTRRLSTKVQVEKGLCYLSTVAAVVLQWFDRLVFDSPRGQCEPHFSSLSVRVKNEDAVSRAGREG